MSLSHRSWLCGFLAEAKAFVQRSKRRHAYYPVTYDSVPSPAYQARFSVALKNSVWTYGAVIWASRSNRFLGRVVYTTGHEMWNADK
ncbi:hypothetical protein PsYK624_123220 [Phanerochaete sordida]|uniref:Uncharacterized protein n=1 Tax=Phanerochaete sordida TaxID=48140 RepID=A0A9P3LIX8_9APHY|nr:hypothetical protein PsYK624_123220 [Phanerochaete sordida]